VLGVSQLSNEKWSSSVSNGNTESDEESGGDEHLNVDTDRLENDTTNHDNTTSDDTYSTTKDIGNIWGDWEGDD
jgi:hypothetical protein